MQENNTAMTALTQQYQHFDDLTDLTYHVEVTLLDFGAIKINYFISVHWQQ